MRSAWFWIAMTHVVVAAACSFPPPPDVGDDMPGDDGGEPVDGGVGTDDAATPPRTRAFFGTSSQEHPTAMYLSVVEDGIPGPSVALSPEGAIRAIEVSADGSAAVFEDSAPATPVLYRVRIAADGSPAQPQVCSSDHGGGHRVTRVWLAGDGARMVYTWGTESTTVAQYYLVDLSGTQPGVPVPLTGGGSPSRGTLSPDGRYFAYVEAGAVIVVDISGTSPQPTTLSLASATVEVTHLGFSPTSTRLAVVADRTTDNQYELYVSDVSGGIPRPLERASPSLTVAEDVRGEAGIRTSDVPVFSPNGSRLVFLTFVSSPAGQIAKALYAVDVSASVPGIPFRINDAPVSGGAFDITQDAPRAFAVIDDGHVVYRIDQRVDDAFELFRADISGTTMGTTERISGDLVAGGDVAGFHSADGGLALGYTADQRTDTVLEGFYVDLRASQAALPVALGTSTPSTGNVSSVTLSPDGTRLTYINDSVHVAAVSNGTPAAAERVSDGWSFVQPTFAPDGDALYWGEAAQLWISDLSEATPATPVAFDVPRVVSLWLR